MGNHLESPRGSPHPEKIRNLNKDDFANKIRENMAALVAMDPAELQRLYNETGRNRLNGAREIFFTSLLRILGAEDTEERKRFIPIYAESMVEIVSASVSIAWWKLVEGISLTDSVREEQVRKEWKEKMRQYRATEEVAEKWVARSIKTTKIVQERLGVTEDPPAGGMRAEHEREMEAERLREQLK